MAVATESPISIETTLEQFDSYIEQRREAVASLEGTMPEEAKKLTAALDTEIEIATKLGNIVKQIKENGTNLSNQEIASLSERAKELAGQIREMLDSKGISKEVLAENTDEILADSVSVKQEGIKFTVTTKPPKADMTLMDVFKELGDKVDIEYIRNNLKSVDLNAKLGTEEIELIIFDRPGTEKENHAFIEEQGLSLEVDPKRVLYMAAVLRKKAIDGNLNEAEANLYNILKTGFIRFG
ncbi:MAG: hypothetical protein KDD56_02730, partial [Bdellovibrionales bacterium]|nr:hypothetical protein [Bdellovibrionales bacterium]